MTGISWFNLLPLACLVALMFILAAFGKIPLAYNRRHLMLRWKTTIVTTLAFTLVVFLLVVMLAFVNGMEHFAQAGGRPGNVIVLSRGVTDELLSYLPLSEVSDIALMPDVLRDEHGRPLCSREIYTVISQPDRRGPGERSNYRMFQIRGIEEPGIAGRIHGLKVHAGGCWFSEAGVRDSPAQGQASQTVIEAVVGDGAARELALKIGDLFEVGPRLWLVVGILDSAGSPFTSEIWAQRRVVGTTFGIDSALTSIILTTANADSARRLAAELGTRLKKADLWALPESEYYARMAKMNRRFLVAAYAVATFMGLGGALSVMNTLFAAVAQRTREIGILRVLGYTRRQILASFLMEALALAFMGGLAGCALSFLAHGWSATSTVSGAQGIGKEVVLKLLVDGNAVTVGLLFTLVMGVLGGLLPAFSATRVRPLESLR